MRETEWEFGRISQAAVFGLCPTFRFDAKVTTELGAEFK